MFWYRVARNGSQNLMPSKDNSFWRNGFWFTNRRLHIENFTRANEDLYKCVIKRAIDRYVADKEIFLSVKGKTANR